MTDKLVEKSEGAEKLLYYTVLVLRIYVTSTLTER